MGFHVLDLVDTTPNLVQKCVRLGVRTMWTNRPVTGCRHPCAPRPLSQGGGGGEGRGGVELPPESGREGGRSSSSLLEDRESGPPYVRSAVRQVPDPLDPDLGSRKDGEGEGRDLSVVSGPEAVAAWPTGWYDVTALMRLSHRVDDKTPGPTPRRRCRRTVESCFPRNLCDVSPRWSQSSTHV